MPRVPWMWRKFYKNASKNGWWGCLEGPPRSSERVPVKSNSFVYLKKQQKISFLVENNGTNGHYHFKNIKFLEILWLSYIFSCKIFDFWLLLVLEKRNLVYNQDFLENQFLSTIIFLSFLVCYDQKIFPYQLKLSRF